MALGGCAPLPLRDAGVIRVLGSLESKVPCDALRPGCCSVRPLTGDATLAVAVAVSSDGRLEPGSGTMKGSGW